jgi:hypothetical protein
MVGFLAIVDDENQSVIGERHFLPTRLSALSTKPPCICPGSTNERRQDSCLAATRDEGCR